MGWQGRNEMVVRQWRLLVLLRRQRWTLPALAAHCGVCERTIRRDLTALQAVPLPIVFEPAEPRSRKPAVWALASASAWPRNEATPVREVRAC